jgi:N-acetylneuraminic acid mutarotase
MAMSVHNLQDGSGDSGADSGGSVAKAFSRHFTSWSMHVSVTTELLEIPSTKNHTATLVGNEVYVFGGYDGQKNHNELFVFELLSMEWRQPQVLGTKPSGRNGHSATLLRDGQQILILGGWLGNGPLAAGDMHLLNLDPAPKWATPNFAGDPPGPCNMHTADLVGRHLFVFRGGDGRAYLNDLHGLDLDSNSWYPVKTSGEQPPPRANHASAVDDFRLYIFGGWDGTKRLNDLYVLDTREMVWSLLKPTGCAPQARAGMTLSIIRDCLYLFGGSGHTTRCFNDVHVYDPKEQAWFLCVQIANEPISAPERRAGHVAVVVDRRLFISGGACGTQYYGKGKWFILDTDAPPSMQSASAPLCAESVRRVMSDYLNRQQFSDVTFLVEGRRLYSHRILLTLFSDYFRRAFACGMRETFEPEIVIEGISYETFYALLEFLYTGKLKLTEAQLNDVCFLMGLLRAADQFCVDCVKQMCEKHLSSLVDNENVEGLLQEAERFQAHQLRQHCEWFRRQEQFTGDEDDGQMGVPPGCGLAEPSPIVCMAELASSSAQQPCTPAASPEGEAPKTDSTWLGEALYEATMEVDPSNAPEFGKGQGDV